MLEHAELDRTSLRGLMSSWRTTGATLIRGLRRHEILDPLLVLMVFLPLMLVYLVGPPPEEFWGDVVGQSDYAAWVAMHPGSLAGSWFPPSSVPMWVLWPSPAIALSAIFYAATGNLWTAIKAVQVIQVAVAVVCAYYLGARVGATRFGRAVTSLAYVSAPFFQTQLAHHPFNSWGYALLPAMFLLVGRYIEKRTFRTSLIAGLAVGAILVSTPEAVFLYGLPLVVFGVSYSISGPTPKGIRPGASRGRAASLVATWDSGRKLATRLLLNLAPLGLGFLFSAFYLWPTVLDPFPYRPTEFGYPREIWRGGDLVSLVTLQYYEFFPFTKEPLSPVFALVPLATIGLACVGVLQLLRNRNPLTVRLGIAGAVAFALSFASPSFPSPFSFLRDVLPWFGFLRTPDRFLPTAILALSIFAGTGAPVVVRALTRLVSRRHVPAEHPGHSAETGHDTRTVVVTCILAIGLVVPFVAVFYGQNTAYFMGAFRNTTYTSTVDSYREVHRWLVDHTHANTRILDLTDVGENRLHTLDLPSVVYPGRSLVSQFGYSSQLPSLLCKLGIGLVVSPSTNFSGNQDAQTYALLRQSDLYVEHDLGVSEASALDILEHRLPARVQGISVFESRGPCDATYPGRIVLTLAGPRAILSSDARFPTDIPALLSAGPNLGLLGPLAPVTDALVLDDPSLIDLGMRVFGRYVPLSTYAQKPWERVVLQGGFEQPFGELAYQSVDGYLVLGDSAITASEKGTTLTVPFDVQNPEKVAVVVRTLGSSPGEIFTARIDSHAAETINTSEWRGFRWVVVSNETMAAGSHTLTIAKLSDRRLTLDSMAVMPWDEWTLLPSTAGDFVDGHGIPMAFAVNPASLWANPEGGQTAPLSESLNLANWDRRGSQELQVDSDLAAPMSPVIRWQYTSGPFEFVDLMLSQRSLTPEWSLDFWVLGRGVKHYLTLWLVLEDGSYVDHEISLDFDGWERFSIPLTDFRGVATGSLSFTKLRIIPSPGNGSTALGGLMFRLAPSVTPSLDSPAGQQLVLPANSSVSFSYVAPVESAASMELVFDGAHSHPTRVCLDTARCQAVTDLQDGVGRIGLDGGQGPHVVSIHNDGTATEQLDYVWIETSPAEAKNSEINWSVRPRDVGYIVSVNATAPVAVVAGESFDPGWTAADGKAPLVPFFAGLWSVGFVVGTPGPHEIGIVHTSSTAQTAGNVVSVAMVALTIATAVLALRDRRAFRRKSRRRFA